MNAWLGRTPWVLGWLAMWTLGTTAWAASPSADQVRVWIRNLEADSFADRELATRELTAAGHSAAAALENAAANGSPEVMWRAASVLAQISANRTETAQAHAGNGQTDQCSDESQVATDGQAPAPLPPPEADIAQALAPPPPPPPLDSITDQVLIADAYVSPELVPDTDAAVATTAPAPSVAQPVRALSSDQPSLSRTLPAVTLVRQPILRMPVSYSRENPPRLINFFQKARTFLGLSLR